MTTTALDELADLHRLKQAASRCEGELDANQLERDFLTFASLTEPSRLTVHLPRSHLLEGEERSIYRHAAESMGIAGDAAEIDISGCSDFRGQGNAVIVISPHQLAADHFNSARSYMNPLLEVIYSSAGSLLTDFGLHRGLTGTVHSMRGNLDLSEAPLFPERFQTGPYSIWTQLDTPDQDVSKFVKLEQMLTSCSGDPKRWLLDNASMNESTRLALELRSRLGSLSRCQVADSTAVTAEALSCVVRYEESTTFYLYEPKRQQNVAVYFGKNPFPAAPENLTVLPGDDAELTLSGLVDTGICEPSETVIEARLLQLQQMFDQATRKAKVPMKQVVPEFEKVLESLGDAQRYFRTVVNLDMRRAYIKKIDCKVVEHMVYPATEDPVVHELLPRISWTAARRLYHDTEAFADTITSLDEAGRRSMLQDLQRHILFANQQNNTANVWLYRNHRELCQSCGIEFQLQ